MYRNSEIEETGVAAGVLGHPALGVAWLANKLGQHGVSLDVGHLVLAGSFTRVVFARKGDTLHADFGALGGIPVQSAPRGLRGLAAPLGRCVRRWILVAGILPPAD